MLQSWHRNWASVFHIPILDAPAEDLREITKKVREQENNRWGSTLFLYL
jgi:hypothetical protein